MYHTIAEFLADWAHESAATAKIMEALTDASLVQRVTESDRTLGWTAWHIISTLAEMPAHVGLELTSVESDATVPATAAGLAVAYRAAAAELGALIGAEWNDETLKVEDNLYGQVWSRALTLQALIRHEIHHRAQMTVLMRQAGLPVPGTYGPSREEWAARGMATPAT